VPWDCRRGSLDPTGFHESESLHAVLGKQVVDLHTHCYIVAYREIALQAGLDKELRWPVQPSNDALMLAKLHEAAIAFVNQLLANLESYYKVNQLQDKVSVDGYPGLMVHYAILLPKARPFSLGRFVKRLLNLLMLQLLLVDVQIANVIAKDPILKELYQKIGRKIGLVVEAILYTIRFHDAYGLPVSIPVSELTKSTDSISGFLAEVRIAVLFFFFSFFFFFFFFFFWFF
jgi:hypothetical protein